jgi:hypothetical protein
VSVASSATHDSTYVALGLLLVLGSFETGEPRTRP